jgi:hypothetical protein
VADSIVVRALRRDDLTAWQRLATRLYDKLATRFGFIVYDKVL